MLKQDKIGMSCKALWKFWLKMVTGDGILSFGM